MTIDWNRLRFMIRLHARAEGVFAWLGDSIFSLRGGRLTAITDPDANQRAIRLRQAPRSLPDLHLSFTIFPDCFLIFQETSRVGPLKATRVPSLFLTGCRTQTEVMVAKKRSPPTEDFARCVGGFFSPPLLGRQRCSWWILKQILLIIVFHNCHAERDCPLRSYLCHCTHTPPPTRTPPPPSLYRLFNKTQITTEIVKSTSKIIKSKWRIYRWHFITINLRHLINKTPCAASPDFTLLITKVVLFEWDEGGGEQSGWLSGTTRVSFFLINGASWPRP